MKTKSFDCVEWVRKIRDKNFEQYHELSVAAFADKLSREARKSVLWKKFSGLKAGTGK